MTSWASAMKHMTFSLAMVKSNTLARKQCAKNAEMGNGVSLSKATLQVNDHVWWAIRTASLYQSSIVPAVLKSSNTKLSNDYTIFSLLHHIIIYYSEY